LTENDRAFLFLMDYPQRRRVKIWGRARVVADDPQLLARLMPEGYDAQPQQAILFTIEAWDVNCPQHIPQKFDAADVAAAVEKLEHRIGELETENARLRASLGRTSTNNEKNKRSSTCGMADAQKQDIEVALLYDSASFNLTVSGTAWACGSLNDNMAATRTRALKREETTNEPMRLESG
jgi:hypothetical protein